MSAECQLRCFAIVWSLSINLSHCITSVLDHYDYAILEALSNKRISRMFWKKDTPQYGNWRLIAAVMFVVMLIVNGLAASTTLLGGITTAAVSDSYPNLFAPSGFTFSIWSVIYTLLALYLVSTVYYEPKNILSNPPLSSLFSSYLPLHHYLIHFGCLHGNTAYCGSVYC